MKAKNEHNKNLNLDYDSLKLIVHDLRSPITLINSYAHLLKDYQSEITPDNLQIIIDETERLNMIIEDILELPQMENNTPNLKIETFNLVSLVKEISTVFTTLLGAKGYTFEFICNIEALFVDADRLKIGRVIHNLLANAVNYAGQDKLIIINLYKKENSAVLEITDHGQGIPPEKLPNIWDKYNKADTVRNLHKGSGLGLYIVKSIMLMHKGSDFGVSSTVGEGTTFFIKLQI